VHWPLVGAIILRPKKKITSWRGLGLPFRQTLNRLGRIAEGSDLFRMLHSGPGCRSQPFNVVRRLIGVWLKAKFRKFLSDLAETFWLLPAAMVMSDIFLAVALIRLDRDGMVPGWLIRSPWLYHGGGIGARTLLGAVASSTIGVAGTVFSITIATLSLAAGQMRPRLLRNFTRDRGNQFTLGVFLGTFHTR